MTYKRTEPYNDLPLLPPQKELETKRLLKLAIKANTALARLDGSARQLPNQSVLIDSIGLQEAKISSEIENIVTTNDELYQAYALEKKVKNLSTKEVLHYQEALRHGYNVMEKREILTTTLFIDIANIIKETELGVRNTAGTVIKNPITDEIIYTPPVGKDVILNLLKNLEEYIHVDEDDVDQLIKMAVIHYQFEAIHPFYDGNGRTGRIINILYLINKQKLQIPILYLSKYIIDHKNEYYRLIRSVTETGNWEEWIEYNLIAIESTARYTQEKIDRIIALMQKTKREIRQKLPKIYSKELLEVIFMQPYCKRKFLVDEKVVRLRTAGKYLEQLEEIGVFKSVKVGREKLYINLDLFDILSD